ncbi:MAG: DNA-3-methyladenine glycosylase 2 family protein [Planctomycetota bacterium]
MSRLRKRDLALAATDPVMRRLVDAHGPCPLRRQREREPFSVLASSIVSQMVSTAAARTILARIEAAAGGLDPRAIGRLDEPALRGLGLSRAKALAMRALSEQVLSGELDLDDLGRRPAPAIYARLTALPGIGVWTANMYLIFYLGRPDVFPERDLGIQEGIRIAYALPRRPTAPEARARAERWAPYRSLAAWYLWRAKDGPAAL